MEFTLTAKVVISDHDADLVEMLPETIMSRFDGTAITVQEVQVTKGDLLGQQYGPRLGRCLIASYRGNTLAELESAATDEAEALFGPEAELRIDVYCVKPTHDQDKKYWAEITVHEVIFG